MLLNQISTYAFLYIITTLFLSAVFCIVNTNFYRPGDQHSWRFPIVYYDLTCLLLFNKILIFAVFAFKIQMKLPVFCWPCF